MVTLFLVSLLAAAPLQTAARGVAVSGLVQDQTTAVLTGAQVSLLRAGTESPLQSGMTDASGAFHFERVAPGDYEIRAEFPGFKTVAAKVRVGARAPAPVTIVLPLEGLTQEIAVSGASVGVNADARSNL